MKNLHMLARKDFNKHWLVPDGCGFVKVIPKANYLSRVLMHESAMSQELDASVRIIEEFVKANPSLLKNPENLKALLQLEAHLLDVTTKMRPLRAQKIRRTINNTQNYAVLASIGMMAEDLKQPSKQQRCLDKLELLKKTIRELEPNETEAIESVNDVSKRIQGKHDEMDKPQLTTESRQVAQQLLAIKPDDDMKNEPNKNSSSIAAALLYELNSIDTPRVIKFLFDERAPILSDDDFCLAIFLKLDKSKIREILKIFAASEHKMTTDLLDHAYTKNLISLDEASLFVVQDLNFEQRKKYLEWIPALDSSYDFIISLAKNGLEKELLFKHVENYDFPKIVKIFKAIGQTNLLADYTEYTDKNYQSGPTDKYCFRELDKTSEAIKVLKQLISLGATISPSIVSNAFVSQNYEYLAFILEEVTTEWIEQNAECFLKPLMALEDENVANLVLEKAPSLRSKCPISLLSKAVSNGNSWFVEWVLKDLQPSSQEISKLLPVALQNRNLHMIKCLCDKQGGHTYPQILGLDRITNPEELVERITQYAVMSPLDEVYELARSYPAIASVLPQALNTAALVVRFPNLTHPTELNQANKNVETYLQGTLGYARENLNFLMDIMPKLSTMSRDKFLDAIIQNRYGRFTSHNLKTRSYITKQTHEPKQIVSTPLSTKTLNYDLVLNSKLSRYSHSWKHFAEMSFDWKKKKWDIPRSYPSMAYKSSSKETVGCVAFTYTNPEGGRSTVSTTKLFVGQWHHTEPSSIIQLQDHLENLQQEIVNFPLDYFNPESRKQFFEKVSRGYWLIATLCEVHRGTPHNAMIWLNAIYKKHNLPPPIPKQDHFFLDNTMLMIPVERAIEKWETFFELPLDRSLQVNSSDEKSTVLQTLLGTNGMLMELCSPEIRDDENLVRIAVRQNPAAISFASKRLQTVFNAKRQRKLESVPTNPSALPSEKNLPGIDRTIGTTATTLSTIVSKTKQYCADFGGLVSSVFQSPDIGNPNRVLDNPPEIESPIEGPPTKPQLRVSIYHPDDHGAAGKWAMVNRTASAWESAANSKNNTWPWFNRDQQFVTLADMAGQIEGWTRNIGHRLYICEATGFEGLQAIAIADHTEDPFKTERYVKLHFIVINPENIRTRTQVPRVTGAGKAIMNTLIEECRKQKLNSIQLHAEESAISLYEHLGFKMYSKEQHNLMILEISPQGTSRKRGSPDIDG